MLKKYYLHVLVLLCLAALFQLESCSTLNPPETIPCYGHIDSIGVSSQYLSEGTASSAISCAWVYVDDQPVGTFEMPCTFPMLATTGTHTVIVIPGVTADGAASTREKYPFYTYYDSVITITQGSITKFNFKARYQSNVDFVWMEDFDEPSSAITSFTRDNIGTDTNLIYKVSAPYAFEGLHSGQVVLDSNIALDSNMVWEAYTDTMSLPNDGSPVFMELNYNTNTNFGVGIVPCTNGYDFYTNYGNQLPVYVFILPGNGWQKIYIDLTSGLVDRFTTHFRLFFSMNRTPGVNARLLLDNIKVLHTKGS